MRISIKFILIVLVIMGLTAGCGSLGSGSAKGEEVHIRGEITALSTIEADNDVLGTILVEGEIEEDTEYDKASITITEKTKTYKINEGKRETASFNDLQIGQHLEVRFTGPVAESYPVQVKAGQIMIMDEEGDT